MSILKRFSDIMASNINALLDKAEDPSKMVDQLLRNLNSDLGKIKSETASVMAEEARARRELDECKAEIDKLMLYANKALDAGNENDAKMFLSKKVKVSERLTALQSKYDAAHTNSVRMKEMHDKVSAQIEDLNSRKNTIKAKIATAKMQERINKLGSSVSSASGSLDAFSRMEEKANKMLDEANAMAELNAAPVDEVADLMCKYDNDNSSSVDDELEMLKRMRNS